MRDRSVVETWSYLTKGDTKELSRFSVFTYDGASSRFVNKYSVNKVDPLGHFRQSWKESFISTSGYSNAVENSLIWLKR